MFRWFSVRVDSTRPGTASSGIPREIAERHARRRRPPRSAPPSAQRVDEGLDPLRAGPAASSSIVSPARITWRVHHGVSTSERQRTLELRPRRASPWHDALRQLEQPRDASVPPPRSTPVDVAAVCPTTWPRPVIPQGPPRAAPDHRLDRELRYAVRSSRPLTATPSSIPSIAPSACLSPPSVFAPVQDRPARGRRRRHVAVRHGHRAVCRPRPRRPSAARMNVPGIAAGPACPRPRGSARAPGPPWTPSRSRTPCSPW